MAPRYSLSLLGGAGMVRPDGKLMERVAQGRRMAVLALLATAPRGVLARERIVALLWPDYAPARGRHLLAVHLHEIRRTLGADAVVGAGETIALDSAVVGSDVAAFTEALKAGALEAAVAQYGGPFLDGFHVRSGPAELERWVMAERARLASACGGALERLALDARHAGDHNRAAEWWRRLTILEPYSSRPVLELLLDLVQTGDAANALRYAREHAERMRRDLDVEPDPALAEFVREFRHARSVRVASPASPSEPTAAFMGTRTPELHSAVERACARAMELLAGFTVDGMHEGLMVARSALAQEPNSPSALGVLGAVLVFLYDADGDRASLDEGMLHLRRAIEIQPGLAMARHCLSYALCRLGQYGEAEREALDAVAHAPGHHFSYVGLGGLRVWWSMDDHRCSHAIDAIAVLRRAIEMDPNETSSYMFLSTVYLLAGQYDPARALLDRAMLVESSGTHPVRMTGAAVLRALLHRRVGEWDYALSLLKEAERALVDSTHVHGCFLRMLGACTHADIAHQSGRPGAAVDLYTHALDIADQHRGMPLLPWLRLRAHVGRAIAFNRTFLLNEERDEIARALALLPDLLALRGRLLWEVGHAYAHFDMARYYAAAGHREEMLNALHAAVSAGWGDLPWLAKDICFARYERDEGLDAIRAAVRARAPLPDDR